ncbi:peptide deformylase [Catalinimonas niigatensis]|uniref:peptide deformylase n=1 Tax=Catalinimonas niigatensis TaxID=1397264 RepID=UPI002666C546|nr:peptide deformylase [Catalinimonas niigatensis]WPP48063.1 peptide deformylase [Catalinimonas niigatensis]
MIYPIVLYGDPVLKKPAENIQPESIDVKQLSEDMFETMYQASGVGLAAPQIGKSLRMFVVDSGPLEDDDDSEDFKRVFINPEILSYEGDEWSFEEGCLSIPGIRADVFRPEIITIKYLDENWEEHIETLEDMPARIVLHEYDHIEGVLFTDHVKGLKKRLIKGKLSNITQGKVDANYKVKLPPKLAKR